MSLQVEGLRVVAVGVALNLVDIAINTPSVNPMVGGSLLQKNRRKAKLLIVLLHMHNSATGNHAVQVGQA